MQKSTYVILLAVALAGCRSSPFPYTSGSSFELVTPDSSGRTEPVRGPELTSAANREDIPGYINQNSVTPVFPEKALAGRAPPRTIYVEIHCDSDGRVVEVTQSWRDLGLIDEWSDLFLASIRDAVMKWEVEPPCEIHYEILPNGMRRDISRRRLSATFEVKFTFTASGRVE